MSSASTKATDTSDTGEELQAVTVSQASRHKNLTLLAYGALTLPWSLAGLPILLHLPAYYATELHLSAGLVGMVFLGARLWDGLTDILVGWFSDRTTSRFGRRKPWVMVGAPLLMASTWFLCNPPVGAGLVYLGVWAALFYTAATVVGIPYLSWGTELATDYVERSRVTAFREAFAMLGNLLFAAAPLLLPADAPLQTVLLLRVVARATHSCTTWLAVRDIATPQDRRPSRKQSHRQGEIELARQHRFGRRRKVDLYLMTARRNLSTRLPKCTRRLTLAGFCEPGMPAGEDTHRTVRPRLT